MKYFIQYWQKSPVTGELIEVCGDRGVVILDGRCSIKTMIQNAKNYNGCRRPFYDAFQIHKGRILQSTPVTEVLPFTRLRSIIEIYPNGDPYGRGFEGRQSDDGGKSWYHIGGKGPTSRDTWRQYAKRINAILRYNK